MAQVKFREVPIGGRIKEYGKTWVVFENYGNGLLVEYTGKNNIMRSVCSFVDEESSITLETEVNFIN
jgi:hypothetical protein